MIISDVTSKKWRSKSILLTISVIIVLFLLYLFFPLDILEPQPTIPGTYYCDMEVVEKNKFVSNGMDFGGGKTQNGDYSRSGKFSSFLNKSKEYQYGAGLVFQDFHKGEMFKASVWRYREKGGDDGYLAVSGKGEGKFYKSTASILKSVDGWELLEINFRIPTYKNIYQVSVYVFTEGKYPVYFDDLLIQKISDGSSLSTSWSPQSIQLRLKPEAVEKLNEKRLKAFQNGILESSEDDWVKTSIICTADKNPIPAELRLKGDWLDHLEGDKWSFRIKTSSGEAFNRMQVFSLHTPKARGYLHEWVLHQLFQQEDVLTTFYDFLIVKLNDKNLGTYAIEEHFDKVLLERQKRREGPIVRLSEDGYWKALKRQLVQTEGIDYEIKINTKSPKAAPVTPFKEKKTISSPQLKDQLEQAVNLMEQYKMGQIDAADIFDLKKIAQYYAICEALGAYHGITWFNQRFYYNPLIGKLEPIGFDGFDELLSRRDQIIGAGAFNSKNIQNRHIENYLFRDLEFTRLYSHYLYKYTSRSFLELFFARIDEDLKVREALLQTEFDDYFFNLDQLLINAQRINLLLLPFDEHSVKAFTQNLTYKNKILKTGNFHSLPIELIGSGKSFEIMTDTFKNVRILESYYDKEPVTYFPMSIKREHEYLFFKAVGIDSVFYTKIHPWDIKSGPLITQTIFNNITLSSNEVYTVEEKAIYFKKGEHKIFQPIVIPEGYRLYFEEGCQLDFLNNSKFISKSPVFMYGTESEPVLIRSSDKSARGFTILQAPEESVIHYASFDQFNTLIEKGWTLTGAVTFYESDVLIDHGVFSNSQCEDALNIIRSTFTLKNSQINNTFGDGLDADFCKGTIFKTSFYNTGNDGMDFSGSVIKIENVYVEKNGDKGVSVGENSKATLENISIKNAEIAVAAKDLSTITIENIILENCNQGFVAFQKKPEYGGADIIVRNYKADQIKRLYNILEGCTLIIDGQTIQGEHLEH